MPDESNTELIAQWNKEVSELYDYALTEKGVKQAGLLAISDELAQRFLKECGCKVFGFCHIVDAQAIRHIHKQHGSERTEVPRGQVAITRQDILNLRLVMIEPETLEIDLTPTHSKLVKIKATKQVSGHTLYYVMEIRTGRWRLAPVTLYKRRIR